MKRKLLTVVLVSMLALGMSACTQNNKDNNTDNNNITTEQSGDNTSQNNSSNEDNSDKSTSTDEENSSNNNEASDKMMAQIESEAVKGINICCSNVKLGDNISDVKGIYGEASEQNYVSQAKGTYYNYKDKKFAFGCNKGEQIFEIRSYDDRLKQLNLNDIQRYFGNPDYENKTSVGEKVVGYVVSKDYKLLFVFDNDKLDHYSVFYPEITANYMADDPGREW